ncbi:MAG: hypothetical protein AVDCRST_MAG05-1493, partial [uncultured Rubrobacteraceae bacterium]
EGGVRPRHQDGAPAQDPQLPGHRDHLDVDQQPSYGRDTRHGRRQPARRQPGQRGRRSPGAGPRPRRGGPGLPGRRGPAGRDGPDEGRPGPDGALPDPPRRWI